MAISNSDIPQPLWERAVALVQKQGMPVNASTIQSAMNTLAEGGSGGADVNMGANIDALMNKTDGTAPSPAPVTSAPLQTPLPGIKPITASDGADYDSRAQLFGVQPITAVGKLLGNDDIAARNLAIDNDGQGPASLNSHDAEAPDPRGKPITPADTANAAPGTQGMNDMGLEDASAVGGMSGSDAAMGAGGLSALIATLTKRNKPSLGQSIHLGDAMARPAINQFEGMMKEASPDEMKKARAPSRARSGRGGGAKMRNKGSKPYDPDMTLM